jgi:PAS domain S-box-containing protein
MLSDGMILELVRDSNERKQVEESLRQAEEKYRNIFEQSLDGIFQSTPAGRFITVNPALARMWGYESPDDLINSINNIALQVYVNPEVRNEFLRVMDEDEQVHGFEIQVYRKDGSVLWVQESVRTVKDMKAR